MLGSLQAWAFDPTRDPNPLFPIRWRRQVKLYKSITTGPFMGFFFNRNTTMNLRGHGHSCSITLEWETLGDVGFPAFESTYAAIQRRVTALLSEPFRDHTNEKVADFLWDGLVNWSHEDIDRWGGQFRLRTLDLGVLGVPDDIGHANGWTTYRVCRVED